MNQNNLQFHTVSFSYNEASYYLFKDISVHFPYGWTGIVGENGAGKSTLLKLASGILIPNQGHIGYSSKTIYCPQRTDFAPELLRDFILSFSDTAYKIKGILKIEDDWLLRWESLSHGERKRAQIGTALWCEPDCLAVDEPTNHLDIEARSIVNNALSAYKGIGILVSHDRELLDTLCCQCVFVDPPGVITRPGGVTQGLEQQKLEQNHLLEQKKLAKQNYKKLKDVSRKRRAAAEKQKKQGSKRNLARKDHDTRFKINAARVTGKDASRGRLLRQLDGRLRQAEEKYDDITLKRTYKMGIWLEGTCSKRDTLFHIPAKTIPLGNTRSLYIPDLSMKPDDRIGLIGPNGTGKSTLINFIFRNLHLPEDRIIYLAQEIDIETSVDIINRVHSLPREKLGHLMTIISSLGSQPERLLDTKTPSPGEIRKLLLAIGITSNPHLIIMDEPTNHLDLPSIECLEAALADCPCGHLLISHDRQFLDNLCNIYWEISEDETSKERYRLKIM